MQSSLFARELGDLSPHAFSSSFTSPLLRSFAAAPQHRFNGERTHDPLLDERPHNIRAHGAGVASLAVEKFDGRLLVSGGAEGAIKIWDLEQCGSVYEGTYTFRPVSTIRRSTDGSGHSHGITHLDFFPFDPDAFLSSAFDKSLKLWSTARSTLSGSFDLNARIYSHSTSPIADHLVVACATQHAHVRLVDLRSGSAVQALIAHGGPVLATQWSPTQGHIVTSGHADGKIRVWDIRRAGGVLSLLDQEDSLGLVHRHKHAVAAGMDPGQVRPYREAAQAHDDAVNGLHWTSDGKYIISAGMDNRIRVWDAATGANTLTSFGPLVQNRHAKTTSIVTTPPRLSENKDVLFWANDQEILALDLHDGKLITRLRSPGAVNPVGPRGSEMGRNRISALAWRSAGGGGASVGPVPGGGNSVGALYSAHLDGQIRAWIPQIPGPDDEGGEDPGDEEDEGKRRKRKAIDDAYKTLMGKNIRFT
ncbi:uncharacterized protein J7T54_003130 [Emericellopsis cladophorae]|uniref:DNA excision repair protein ERCC-8 n=1 Tax=Emericellopsis cladophorae TaxID=2686198 RepID=A0A9P9XZV5_9HYPO|nr:uncharacterized protein J7T54_003130 [Emericellopsis cladophorae]KAI6780988.1 hypothetical protein J7T54_003130 [Emericellopsis cladophorae]